MAAKSKSDILIKATFTNARGEEMFSSQCPIPEGLANKSDLIIEFTLNSTGIQRQGSLRTDKDNAVTWAYPLAASIPEFGDKIGNLSVEVVDKKGQAIMGSSCDVFGKVAEGTMLFEEHLIVGGDSRHLLDDISLLAVTGTPRLVGKTQFTLKQG